MKWAYYNEWEPYCAQWLRNLIAAGHIPAGEVDERDIREVSGDDLKGYGQIHWFAGLGGWGYAARLAGIPDDEPIWTGSCPCQPLSRAGQRKGHADERHLWPAFHALIAECRPSTVFGEQIADKIGYEWMAGVRADLEFNKYAVGIANLPAKCVGAPHLRRRIYFVAYAEGVFGTSSTDHLSGDQFGSRSIPESRNDDRAPFGNTSIESLDKPPFPVLAHAVPNLVGAVSAYGNAIVPQVAAEFMMAARAA